MRWRSLSSRWTRGMSRQARSRSRTRTSSPRACDLVSACTILVEMRGAPPTVVGRRSGPDTRDPTGFVAAPAAGRCHAGRSSARGLHDRDRALVPTIVVGRGRQAGRERKRLEGRRVARVVTLPKPPAGGEATTARETGCAGSRRVVSVVARDDDQLGVGADVEIGRRESPPPRRPSGIAHWAAGRSVTGAPCGDPPSSEQGTGLRSAHGFSRDALKEVLGKEAFPDRQ